MGGKYKVENGCLIPDLKFAGNQVDIGTYGRRHLAYIKQYRRAFYSTLLLNGELFQYLKTVNDEAIERINTLIKEIAERHGINEQLKSGNQMEWVRQMNNIKASAEEIVSAELIYK